MKLVTSEMSMNNDDYIRGRQESVRVPAIASTTASMIDVGLAALCARQQCITTSTRRIEGSRRNVRRTGLRTAIRIVSGTTPKRKPMSLKTFINLSTSERSVPHLFRRLG